MDDLANALAERLAVDPAGADLEYAQKVSAFLMAPGGLVDLLVERSGLTRPCLGVSRTKAGIVSRYSCGTCIDCRIRVALAQYGLTRQVAS